MIVMTICHENYFDERTFRWKLLPIIIKNNYYLSYDFVWKGKTFQYAA